MRYISFNYSSLDRFRQAILVSYMVNVGSDEIINGYRIGVRDGRVTVPIPDANGHCQDIR